MRRVTQGYLNAKDQAVEGLGGGFQFCRLSAEPLFDADGQIRADMTFAELAEVCLVGRNPDRLHRPADSPLLGVHEGAPSTCSTTAS